MSGFGIGSFQKVAQELFGSLVVCSKLPKLGVGARARCNLGKIYWQGTGRQNLCQIVLFCMMVSNCPRCQIVLGVKLSSLPSWCQIVLLAIMVSNCPKCQMVLGVKLSAVSNGPRINPNNVWKKAPRCKYTNVFGFFQTGWVKVKHLPKCTCVVFYARVWLFANIFAKSQTCGEKTIMFPPNIPILFFEAFCDKIMLISTIMFPISYIGFEGFCDRSCSFQYNLV